MSESRAVDGARIHTLRSPASTALLLYGVEGSNVVPIFEARPARSSKVAPGPPAKGSERGEVPAPSPTLGLAEAAGVLQTPPDIGAVIRRLRK